eukprot:scaffold12558_cov64-Cylindrotheca_fusiformis.AAC.1
MHRTKNISLPVRLAFKTRVEPNVPHRRDHFFQKITLIGTCKLQSSLPWRHSLILACCCSLRESLRTKNNQESNQQEASWHRSPALP